MGVLFSQLLRLDATAACVAVFVVALGSLWVYVALAKPSQSPEEYEGSLSDVATAGKAGGGGGRREKREGKRGRAKKVRCNGCLRWLLTLNTLCVCMDSASFVCQVSMVKCLCVCESDK